MKTNNVALVGPQSSVIPHIVSHVANELHKPILSFGATNPTLIISVWNDWFLWEKWLTSYYGCIYR